MNLPAASQNSRDRTNEITNYLYCISDRVNIDLLGVVCDLTSTVCVL
jgi:hypothetical protein